MFWIGFITAIVGEVILVAAFVWYASMKAPTMKSEEDLIIEHIENEHIKTLNGILMRLDRIEEVLKKTTTGNLAHKKGTLLQIVIGTKEILEKTINSKK